MFIVFKYIFTHVYKLILKATLYNSLDKILILGYQKFKNQMLNIFLSASF